MSEYSYVWEYRVRLDRIPEFDAVGKRCERLTKAETRLGDFETVD